MTFGKGKQTEPWNKGIKATGKQLEGLKIGWKNKDREKNGMWKGDKVGCGGLHLWIKRHKSKPKVCECCCKNKQLDLANISQKYKRDVNDFKWLCRSCHMKEDGRLQELRKNWKPRPRRSVVLICRFCGRSLDIDYSERNTRKFCSRKCCGKWKSKNQLVFRNQYTKLKG